jgi:predicted DNA repair protein MutK
LALANGGEFITHIWAILTHAGLRTDDASSNHNTTREIPTVQEIPIVREITIGAAGGTTTV